MTLSRYVRLAPASCPTGSVTWLAMSRRGIGVGVAVLLGLLVSSCGVEPLTETLVEEIEFESVSFPGAWLQPFMPPLEEGEAVTVGGKLRIPATDEPVPLVVIAHGCGGVSGAALGWARDLEAFGIASLVLDSFEGRSIRRVCSGSEGVNQASLLVDLFRAVEALESHDYIDGSNVAVMGLSMGGRTALWSAQERFQDQYDGRPLAAYVAFYPLGCYIQLENETEVNGGPIRIFHGEEDNWLPISQCETYVDRMATGGVDIDLYAYPNAHHGFDDRGLTEAFPVIGALSPRKCVVVEKNGVLTETSAGGPVTAANSCVERGATIAYNAEAREQAAADLVAFLNSTFDE